MLRNQKQENAATARIAPLEPPYPVDAAEQLEAMMPPGVPPILLFRTFARNLPMTRAMRGWGRYELGRQLSLSLRDREIVIGRTCSLCRCEYEWGVHVAFYAERAQLTAAQIASLTHGSARDACWDQERDRLLVEAVDALHATSRISDDLWGELRACFSDEELLDLFMLCGWYHAICFTANATHVPLESTAPRFADFEAPPVSGMREDSTSASR